MLASIGHRGPGGAAWLLWCVLRRYRPVGIVRADVSPGGLPGCLVWRCPEDADCRCAGAVLPVLLQARNLKVGLVLACGMPGQPGTAGQAMTAAHLQGGLP